MCRMRMQVYETTRKRVYPSIEMPYVSLQFELSTSRCSEWLPMVIALAFTPYRSFMVCPRPLRLLNVRIANKSKPDSLQILFYYFERGNPRAFSI
jgi:hypothetical protein